MIVGVQETPPSDIQTCSDLLYVEVFDAEVARNFIWILSVFLDMYSGP